MKNRNRMAFNRRLAESVGAKTAKIINEELNRQNDEECLSIVVTDCAEPEMELADVICNMQEEIEELFRLIKRGR